MPDFSLHDQVALVTGGGRGLGQAIAQGLAEAGAQVAVAARSREEVEATAQRLGAAGRTCWALIGDIADDLTPARLVADVADRAGRLDIVVHAAGNQVRKPALEMTVDDWDAVQRVHLRAAFLLAQSTAAHLVSRGSGGSIVFVASLNSFHALPDIAPYVAAKSGVLGLTRSLAVEWAQHGIRVNAIAPGFFETEMTRGLAEHPGRRAIIQRAPMRRQGTPEELAGAAVYLCSPAASFVTGGCLSVDGGWLSA